MFLSVAQTPLQWSSLHRPILFSYGYQNSSINITNASGYCRLQWSDTEAPELKVGDLIYIFGSLVTGYNTYHRITAVNSNTDVVTHIAYSSNTFTYGKVLYVPTIALYSGITGSDARPIKRLATIRPRANVYDNNTIRVDVSDYLKQDFPINIPAPGNDLSLYNKFWLVQEIGESESVGNEFYVLNAATTHQETQAYATAGTFLNSMPPILFSCGKSIYSVLINNKVVTVVYDADGSSYIDGSQVALGTEAGEAIGTEVTDEAIGID